jgi:primosomal protein N' (replication factor Y)
VRVRTDVPAVPKLFDYAVPESWSDDLTVGSRVRVVLHGRRVGGWVVDDDVTPPPGVEPLPLKQWSGWGPPPRVLELAEWAAWRWAGPVSFFLGAASPQGPVRRLPPAPADARPGGGSVLAASPTPGLDAMVGGAVRANGSTVLRLPPTLDLIDVVLAVVTDPEITARPGGVLVLVPALGWAERLCARLAHRSGQPFRGLEAPAEAGCRHRP